MADLRGKTLFITGASRGIGLAIALRAARDGANVAIAAKSGVPNPKLPGTIHSAAAAVTEAGGQGLALQCDIREEDQVQAAVAATVERFGGIDILVNNASAIWLRGTLDTPMKRFDLMQQVNARGSFLCAQACLPYLRQAANPHILTLAPPPSAKTPLPAEKTQPAAQTAAPAPVADLGKDRTAVSASAFEMPVQGKIIRSFVKKKNDGIDIQAEKGATVKAADSGTVVYAGNEVRGMGNLVLVSHPGGWITAYANNESLLVKKGDAVKKGQPVAKSDTRVHFEVRRANKTLDPLTVLPAQ